MVLASRIGAGDNFQVTPLFFYHSRRTGGMTFYYALKNALDAMFSAMSMGDPPMVRRLEEESFSKADAEGHFFAFVATHATFGLHERFDHGFNFTTILREPVGRLASLYTYRCMRTGSEPEAAGFEAFLDEPENHNEAVKQLSGLNLADNADSRHLQMAQDRLHATFHSFVTTPMITPLIEAYLSVMSLPNVVMARANRTRHHFRFDAAPFRARILGANALDQQLYEHAAAAGQPPAPPDGMSKLSPVTVVIDEIESLQQSVSAGLAIPTEQFLEFAETRPECLDDLGLIWELTGRQRKSPAAMR